MKNKDTTPKANQLRLKCPHCQQPAKVRHSRELAPTFRDGIIECSNIVECGWRGRLAIEYTATLTPSACPSDLVDLPASPYCLPDSPHALPAKLKVTSLSPEAIAKRDQIDLFH